MKKTDVLDEARKRIAKAIKSNAKSLNLSGLGITNLDELPEILELRELESMNLSGNSIGVEGIKIIAERWKGLNELHLGSNNINKDAAQLIAEKLSHLKVLDLSFNKIENEGAKAIAENLKELTSLDLSYCDLGLESVMSIAKSLRELTSLTMSKCEVGDEGAKAIAHGLGKLKILKLHDCKVKIDGAVQIANRLDQLRVLHLGHNKIEDIGVTEIAKKLHNLTELNVSVTKMGNEGALIIAENLTKLQILEIAVNNVTEQGVISIVKSLGELTSLDISSCIISKSTFDLIAENLSKLETLKLFGCELKSEDIETSIPKLDKLKILNLDFNKIDDSGVKLISKKLRKLTKVSLVYNNVNCEGAIAIAENLSELRDLNLMGNNIGDEGAAAIAKNLKKLRFLQIPNNNIGDKGARELTTHLNPKCWLFIANNKIETANIFNTPKEFAVVVLSNNPFKDVPVALTHDFEQLKVWWAETAQNAVMNTSIKIMVNGNGNAGKSTLIHALKNGKCEEEKDSTHGIQIERWEWEEAGKRVDFNIWDFGGQEIFHGTHRLFMQGEAVWLHVFDAETEKSARAQSKVRDRITNEAVRNHVLDYWIDEARKAKQRIVVQTKKEDGSKNPPDAQNNKLAAKEGAAFDYVDSITGSGIIRLRSLITEKAIETNEYGMLMPQKWILVRQHFADNLRKEADDREKIISMTEFKKRCVEEFEIREEHLETLISFLHHSGVIYYNKKYLGDTIIVDQRWALEAIYKPLERGSDFYEMVREGFGGWVRADFIYNAFGSEYRRQHKELFLSLMESCGLCFRLYTRQDKARKDKDWYVFPEFLSNEITTTANDVWQIANPKHRTFRLNLPYLNYYRIQNFIAKLGQNTEKEYIWRNGILIKSNEGMFIVEADYSKPGIVLKIEESAIDDWMHQLTNEFKDSWSNEEMNWVEVVGTKEVAVDIQKLRFKKKGLTQKEDKGDVQSLSELLPKVEQTSLKLVVVSYAKEDRTFVNDLRKQFRGLEGKVVFWYDQKRDGRQDWDDEIKGNFNRADCFIVMVSPDYVDDEEKEYIIKVEIPIMQERKTKDKIPVYCITVTPVDYIPALKSFDYFADKDPIPRDDLGKGTFLNKFVNDIIKKRFLGNQ